VHVIQGTGIDIVSISRISRMDLDAFSDRVLTQMEKEQMPESGKIPQFLAGRFAVKEAVLKALGTGFYSQGIHLKDVEVLNAPSGKPECKLSEKLRKTANLSEDHTVHVSISHEQEFAVGQAIVEVRS
jgi:holo-[acyl-carrier protein] synthase